MNIPRPKSGFWSRVFKVFLPAAALGILILCVILVVFSLGGPAVGNVFPQIVMSTRLEDAAGAGGVSRGLASQDIQHIIIREGNIILTVDDTRAAKAAVQDLVRGMEAEGAFVVSDQETLESDSDMPVVRLAVRVPAERFGDVMDRLAGMAVKVEERTETAEDVTEEYIDLEARIKSMEEARDRLREIMKAAATTEDLLQAEAALAEREAELESLKGRLEFLSKSAKLSLITVTLRPSAMSKPIAGLWRPGETVGRALSGLVWSIQSAINLLIYLVIFVLPWAIVIGLIVLLVRFVRRKFLSKNRKDSTTGGSSTP